MFEICAHTWRFGTQGILGHTVSPGLEERQQRNEDEDTRASGQQDQSGGLGSLSTGGWVKLSKSQPCGSHRH
jgi:hypothetical protein